MRMVDMQMDCKTMLLLHLL